MISAAMEEADYETVDYNVDMSKPLPPPLKAEGMELAKLPGITDI